MFSKNAGELNPKWVEEQPRNLNPTNSDLLLKNMIRSLSVAFELRPLYHTVRIFFRS